MASKHNTENSLLPYAVIKAATVGKNTALLPPPFGSPQMLQANSGAMMNAITYVVRNRTFVIVRFRTIVKWENGYKSANKSAIFLSIQKAEACRFGFCAVRSTLF